MGIAGGLPRVDFGSGGAPTVMALRTLSVKALFFLVQ